MLTKANDDYQWQQQDGRIEGDKKRTDSRRRGVGGRYSMYIATLLKDLKWRKHTLSWPSPPCLSSCCKSVVMLGVSPSAIDRRPAHSLNATTWSSAGTASRAKRGEDQSAKGEDEAERREAKTKAPKVKTKPSEERRRPRHRRRRRSRAKRRDSKTKAPKAKTKASEARRRPMRRSRRRRPAKEGVVE